MPPACLHFLIGLVPVFDHRPVCDSRQFSSLFSCTGAVYFLVMMVCREAHAIFFLQQPAELAVP